MFDPRCTKYPYPEDTGSHYLVVKKNDETVFDKDYPYWDTSKSFRFKQWWVRLLLKILVFPVARFKLGLKIEGREHLKKNKAILKQGAISIANHVHLWDYISIMKAIRPRKSNVLVWAPNIRGENGALMRLVGGIPIPENDLRATAAYLHDVEDLLNKGGWLHLYPEGSMWEYYQPIRPFKRGASFLSCHFNKPIVPLAFSYRKPSRLRKALFHMPACFTLKVGEPLFPNMELEGKEREKDLTKRCFESVCHLAGMNPEDNPYQPFYEEGSERIDY